MIFTTLNLDNIFNQFNMAHEIVDYFLSINIIQNLSITKKGDIFSAEMYIRQFPNASPNININTKTRTINFSCDCHQHKTNKMCKHIGSLLIVIQNMDTTIALPYTEKFLFPERTLFDYVSYHLSHSLYYYSKQIDFTKNTIASFKSNHMKEFKFYDSVEPIEIKLIPIQNYFESMLYLKVGQSRLYKVKDFSRFIELFKRKELSTYGKNASLLHDENLLSHESYDIYQFLNKHQSSLYSYQNKSAIQLTTDNVTEFFDVFSKLPKSYSDLDFVTHNPHIKLHVIKLPFENDECYDISIHDDFEDFIETHHSFYELDVPSKTMNKFTFDEDGKVSRLIPLLREHDPLYVMKTDLNDFYKYCIKDVEEYFNLDDLYPLLTLSEASQLKLYADINDDDMLTLSLRYFLDEVETQWFDEKIADVDSDVERIESYIRAIADDIFDHVAYISNKNKAFYSLLNEGFTSIGKYAEIFVTDAISSIKKTKSLNLRVGVSMQNDLLKIDIDSVHVDKKEIANILNSFKRKKQFHRLKSGEMLNLNYLELEEVDHFLNQLNIDYSQTSDSILMPSYRLFNLENDKLDYQSVQIKRNEISQQFTKQFNEGVNNDLIIPSSYQSVLKDYQKDGVKWLHKIKSYGFGGILADDMGLGKTLQTICFIEAHHQPGSKHLIITPASLILNWETELIKFKASLKFICIHGNANTRTEKLNQIKDYDIIITSYDYLKRDIDQLTKYHFENTFLDEAQYIKNKKTKAATVCKMIDTTSRFALTGTPIENSLAELWSIFDFLMPNYLYSYSYFSKEFERPIVKDQNFEVSDHLKKLVHPFILRRTKNVLENMPDKNEETLTYSFNSTEKNLYVSQLTLINEELADKLEITSKDKILILSMITRLRQICCEPRLIYADITTPSTKLLGCINLILKLRKEGKSCLVFSSFTSTLDLIAIELDRFGLTYLTLTGKTSKKQRQENVERFQNNEADVFLISLKAGGTGLNLTQAQAVIHFDPWWNVSAQNQATDRAYRIGQEKDVHVYKLIMEDSIEQRIQALQEMKKGLSDTFVEGNTQNITSMNFDEIIDLLK
ncbi:MAG: SNF2-related protein [Erysipelotrichaceae bacterium]